MNSQSALYISNDSFKAKRRGFFASVPIIVATVVIFVVCVVAVGLIVHFSAPKCDGNGVTQPPTQPPSITTPGPTKEPQVNVRLPTDVMPELYTLVLAPDIYNCENCTFTGSVKILVKVSKAVNSIKLHRTESINITADVSVHNEATNDSVSVTSRNYDTKRQWDDIQLAANLEAGQKYIINIPKFIAPLNPDLRGLYLSTYEDGGQTKKIATSQLQPTDARKTFPCFDEPAFKAKFDISLVRREDHAAISNMPSIANNSVDGSHWFDQPGTAAWIKEDFETTPIMSSYLLAFIVSQFEYIHDTDSQGRLYRNWARPEFTNIADYALMAVKNITIYFEDYYKVPYPLNKTDQAAVPDFNAGAMENWGLIIYRESRLLFDVKKDTTSILQAIGGVVSHELAHMWFGNLVTPDWWDDIWLNEGFASFTQNLGVDQLHPDWEIDAQFVVTQQRSAFDVDSKGASHPIYMEVSNPNQINAIFDTITYRKGATVLRQLYYVLGDKTFKEGIGAYLRNNSYSNTFHAELYRVLTEQAHINNQSINVAEFMDRWILQMGYPVLNCSKVDSGLHLTQNHFLSDQSQVPDPQFNSTFNQTWIVPITMATQQNITQWTNKKEISHLISWMRHPEQTFPADFTSSSWYLLNLRSAAFYRINYDTQNWDALTNQLLNDHTVFTPHDRARIIDDSFALAAAGYISYEIPMNITKYLNKEDHYVPWSSALSQLSYIHNMLFRGSPVYGPFSQYMRSLLQPAFAKINMNNDTGNSHLEKLKRSLIVGSACLYGLTECESQARSLFDEYMNSNFSSLILPDVRSRVLCEGVVTSFVVVWDRLFKYASTENHPGIRNDITRSLACSSEPWILTRYLEYAIDKTKVRLQDASSVFSGVASNPNGLQIVWDFLRSNWGRIVKLLPGSFTTSYFIANLAGFNSQQKLNEMMVFQEQNRELLGSAERAMGLAIENVKINIRWMESNLESISAWLNDNTSG